jgi:hypothetical protein
MTAAAASEGAVSSAIRKEFPAGEGAAARALRAGDHRVKAYFESSWTYPLAGISARLSAAKSGLLSPKERLLSWDARPTSGLSEYPQSLIIRRIAEQRMPSDARGEICSRRAKVRRKGAHW